VKHVKVVKILLGIILIFLLLFNFEYIHKKYNMKNELNIESIDVNESYHLFKTSNPIFLDARPVGFFKYEHIPNAVSLPYTIHIIKSKIKFLPKDSLIITYCDHSGCTLGYLLAKYLRKNGFSHVYFLNGGIDLWRQKGYDMDRLQIEKNN